MVDDTVTGVLADCTQNPFFTQNVINFDEVNRDGDGHGTNGHDTVDRLKSCLDAQFTAAFGGPSPYDGTAKVSGIPSRSLPGQTYDCEDMTASHADIGVNPEVFDQFIADVGSVLTKDGVSDADINTVAKTLIGFKPQIVVAPASQKHFSFQPGEPTDQPAVACSVPGPSPLPSPSPSGLPGTDECSGMPDGMTCAGEVCAKACEGGTQCMSRIYHYCSQNSCHGLGILCVNPHPTPSSAPSFAISR